MLRTTILLLVLVVALPGCRMWGWGKGAPESEEAIVENFTDTQPKPKSEEEDSPQGTFANQNGRSEDPGTGLSDRSRDIERNLGYR